MTATLIIAVAMLAVWLYLSSNLKHRLSAGSTGYTFDVDSTRWTFLHFYDRYSVLMQHVMWLTAAAMIAAWYSHSATAFWILFAALADNILLRALMLFWYESVSHGVSTYTPRKYAAVLTMALALAVYFFMGLLVLALTF
jgi:hypothetical protein